MGRGGRGIRDSSSRTEMGAPSKRGKLMFRKPRKPERRFNHSSRRFTLVGYYKNLRRSKTAHPWLPPKMHAFPSTELQPI